MILSSTPRLQTTAHRPAWESPLIERAYDALRSDSGSIHYRAADKAVLDHAYRLCGKLTAHHSRSFYLASALLPGGKRQAMHALYAFCRVADDIVDDDRGVKEDAEARLDDWRCLALGTRPPGGDPVALAWADARQRYRIPLHYVEQLLDGVAHDLDHTRYLNFDELAAYAYGVASTVGLMSMHITGFSSRQAVPYAIKLGVALQLTNVLRDVGEDLRAGRVYLPLEELAEYGLHESDLEKGTVDNHWREFMRFQIARNRRLYAEAWPGIGLLHPDGRTAVAAAAIFYAAILDDIEAHDYDVFSRRAHIGAVGKMRRLPQIWLKVRAFRDAPIPAMTYQHPDFVKEKT